MLKKNKKKLSRKAKRLLILNSVLLLFLLFGMGYSYLFASLYVDGSLEIGKVKTYVITFDVDNGTTSETSRNVKFNKKIGTLPIPEKNLYEFVGWYTDEDIDNAVTSDYVVRNNITLHAHWTKKPTYTISFNTGGYGQVPDIEIEQGKEIGELPNPNRNGYALEGWYDANYENKISPSTIPNGSITYYANWVDVCKTFSTDSWTTIATNYRSDENYYGVGCEKEIEMDMDDNGTPESYTVRIANTSNPAECLTGNNSDTACGLVIEFVDIIKLMKMNINSTTNEGGWPATIIQPFLNNDMANYLPGDLIQNLVVINSISGGYAGTKYSSTEALYLLAPKEVGDTAIAARDNASPYTRTLDYYVINSGEDSRIKKYNGTNTAWWLRSAYNTYKTTFTYVAEQGRVGHVESNYEPFGVAPAFRVG